MRASARELLVSVLVSASGLLRLLWLPFKDSTESGSFQGNFCLCQVIVKSLGEVLN